MRRAIVGRRRLGDGYEVGSDMTAMSHHVLSRENRAFREALDTLARSDRLTIEIKASTDHLVTKAIHSGSAQVRDMRDDDSRWNYMVGYPIQLAEPPWNQITVGVLTLSSTLDRKQTSLRAGHFVNASSSSLEAYLKAEAAGILRPALA